MEYQLRNYLTEPGCAEQFATEWLRGVKPLREAAGFSIEAAWVVPSEDRFVWVMGWGGPGTFSEADAHYYESPARSALAPDPARLLVSADEHHDVRRVV